MAKNTLEEQAPVHKAAEHHTKISDAHAIKDVSMVQPVDLPPVIAPRAAPTGLGDIVDPDAAQGTRFSGPLLSGNVDDGAPGIALLVKRAKINSAMGTFTIPIVFPAGAVLLKLYTIKPTLYAGGTTPTVALRLTQGGTLMHAAAVALDSVATVIETALTQLLPTNRTVWLDVAAGGATSGVATIMVMYSVPGKLAQS